MLVDIMLEDVLTMTALLRALIYFDNTIQRLGARHCKEL